MKIIRSAIIILAAGTLAACDNPVSSERHEEPEGVVVRSGTTVLLRVLGQQVTGALTVAAGQNSPPLTVRFLARDGDELTPEAGYWLDVVLGSTAVAQWQPDSEGAFSGRLRGIAAGTTSIRFRLMHGAVGAGHEDFATAAGLLNVVVTP